MAADLKDTPTAGLDVQLCGDAHLSNFGVFASPERRLLFDLNDFDETLPGPFEYDVKRMAASFTIAARNNGFSKADTREATMAVGDRLPRGDGRLRADGHAGRLVRPSGRGRDHGLAPDRRRGRRAPRRRARRTRRARPERARRTRPEKAEKALDKAAKIAEKTLQKAHSRDSLQALSKLAELVDGRYRIVSQPPIVVPMRDLAATYGFSADETDQILRDQFRAYRATLQADRRHLLERFEFVDVARKVVGVGSVGTRAFIVLLQGRDAHDPLFLQIKEATASVLEKYLPKSRYKQPGERVVQGQRMMQAASDIFLGWTAGAEADRHLYWRQLRDMKGSAVVEAMIPDRAHVLRPDLRLDARPSACPVRRPGRDRRSTWATATRSTGPSPTSPPATPTRTSRTSRPS